MSLAVDGTVTLALNRLLAKLCLNLWLFASELSRPAFSTASRRMSMQRLEPLNIERENMPSLIDTFPISFWSLSPIGRKASLFPLPMTFILPSTIDDGPNVHASACRRPANAISAQNSLNSGLGALLRMASICAGVQNAFSLFTSFGGRTVFMGFQSSMSKVSDAHSEN